MVNAKEVTKLAISVPTQHQVRRTRFGPSIMWMPQPWTSPRRCGSIRGVPNFFGKRLRYVDSGWPNSNDSSEETLDDPLVEALEESGTHTRIAWHQVPIVVEVRGECHECRLYKYAVD